MYDVANIGFQVFENNKGLGVASATLPTLTSLLQTINGAGIAGNLESAIIGHFDVMTLTLNFRTVTRDAIMLAEPRNHTLELRAAKQNEDTTNGTVEIGSEKHVFVAFPKTFNAGNMAPASPAEASGEYSVKYWATYIDGEKVMELDPRNYICFINGTDYLEPARKAMGL